jgi:hypothetical protein
MRRRSTCETLPRDTNLTGIAAVNPTGLLQKAAMLRSLTSEELDLITFILGQGSNLLGRGDLVEEMNDGGMGSLRFVGVQGRHLGKCVGSAEFIDADGILASVALNVDQNGELFELDIWKVDFSPLHRIAPLAELRKTN